MGGGNMAMEPAIAPAGGRWAAMARKEAAPLAVDAPLLKSTAGLKTLVVDANALIGGGVRLPGVADQFFTVREVLDEVRDPASRFHLATLPVTIRCLEPSEEALAVVIKFSRTTGDFQSLSSVDLKLLALAYTLEAEVHGLAHVRSEPPPLLVRQSSTREKDPPGWGAVENPEEWECIEESEPSGEGKTESHILGLQSLNMDLCPSEGGGGSPVVAVSNGFKQDEISGTSERHTTDKRPEGLGISEQAGGSDSSHIQGARLRQVDEESVGHLDPESISRPNPVVPEKDLSSLLTKLNVAEGVDASKGEVDDDGWQRASSRSTRRNFLKREAKRSARKQTAENANAEMPYSISVEQANSGAVNTSAVSIGTAPSSNMCLSSDTEEGRTEASLVDDAVGSRSGDEGEDPRDLEQKELSMLQTRTEFHDNASVVDDVASNCTDAPSFKGEDIESEESWMMAPLWKSSIACMTADFAMQNVLLQMGLRLISTNGLHIRELNKWVLKCQACNHVVLDVGRLFCPKCGNGGTLFKVSVTVGQNGTVHAGRARRINLRGTRYSLPMPKGGREGAAQNPILREDQLPRARKTAHVMRSVLTDVNFSTGRDKMDQKLAGVKTAAAVFGGRRNPNERRISSSR